LAGFFECLTRLSRRTSYTYVFFAGWKTVMQSLVWFRPAIVENRSQTFVLLRGWGGNT
jgi:hypothetical protein